MVDFENVKKGGVKMKMKTKTKMPHFFISATIFLGVSLYFYPLSFSFPKVFAQQEDEEQEEQQQEQEEQEEEVEVEQQPQQGYETETEEFFEEAEEEKPKLFKASGYLRTRGFILSSPNLIDGSLSYIQSRFRIEPEITPSPDISIKSQIDLLDDVVWGVSSIPMDGKEEWVPQFSNLPSFYGFTPGEKPCSVFADGYNVIRCKSTGTSRMIGVKRVWGEITLFFGKFFIGRMPSHFGMGIFENDGNGFKNEWGDAHFGDTRDRIMFATKPLGMDHPFIIAIGFDKVAENALLGQSDVNQWFIAPLWKDEEKGLETGAFLAARFDSNTSTEIFALDPYLGYKKRNFQTETEITGIFGRTKALTLVQNLGIEKVSISAVNVAQKLNYRFDPFEAGIDIGYSSGEKKGLKDGVINSVPFDPDFNVGLILYEEVMARWSAELASSENTVIQGAQSDLFATRGGVANSLYFMPAFRFVPLENLKSYLGVLFAFSPDTKAFLDPLNPTEKNFRNGKAGNIYGIEIDWGAKIGGENFDFETQLGGFFPGDAFTMPQKPKNIFKALFKFNYKY